MDTDSSLNAPQLHARRHPTWLSTGARFAHMLTDMSIGSLASQHQLRETYRRLTDRVAQAVHGAGRGPRDVLVVAVTTSASPDQIRTLVELGHVDLGETQVQQMGQRVAQLSEFLHRRRQLAGAAPKLTPIVALGLAPGDPGKNDAIRWHMIGPVQRTKVRPLVPLVRLIQSVDSLRLAEELHTFLSRQVGHGETKSHPTVDILVQVNATGDPSMPGVIAPAVFHVCEQIDTMVHVRLRGLMTHATSGSDPKLAESVFARTADIFGDIRSAKIGGREFSVLSMGSSNDFEIAIKHGANIVRIGQALFGESNVSVM